MNEIKDKILHYVKQEYGDNAKRRGKHYSYCKFPEEDCTCKSLTEIDYDTSLIRGGFVDSFEMVSVLVFVESTFDVRIPDKDAVPDNFDTVTKIANLVIKHKK